MFELEKVKDNVHSFSVDKQNFVYNTNNNRSFLNEVEIFSDEKDKKNQIFNGKIIKYSKDKEVYDLNLMLIYKLLENETFIFSNNEIYLLEYELNSDYGIDYKNISILKNNTLKQIGNFIKPITDIQYITTDIIINYKDLYHRTTIQTYDIHTGGLVWQFDLSPFGTFTNHYGEQKSYQVEKIIGVYNDEVLVACKNQLVLALDIHTGKINYQWQDFIQLSGTKDICADANCFVLDPETGKLFLFFVQYHLEIDLKSRVFRYFNLKDELTIKSYDYVGFLCSNFMSFDKTHFYLSLDVFKTLPQGDEIDSNGIAVINRQTKKMDWFYTNDRFGTGTVQPQIAGNKLYQKTLSNELYIFEKTKNDINL